MEQEDKDLLLRVIQDVQPYGIIAEHGTEENFKDGTTMRVNVTAVNMENETCEIKVDNNLYSTDELVENVKPYLRRIEDMTDNEIEEYQKSLSYDYLNSIHVDYRRIIDKGLALVAEEGMYN